MTQRTLTELREQPDAVAHVAATAGPQLTRWLSQLQATTPIVFLARGTSDNVARYAGYLLAVRNGRLTSLALPSVVTMYGREELFASGPAVVAISQSGRSPDLVATLQAARRQGALALAITNAPTSPLARAAEHVLDLGCGPERGVAATKSYTASLAALAELSQGLAHGGPQGPGADQVVPALREVVKAGPDTAAAKLLIDRRRCVVVGRGFHLATAHEAALKLQELTGLTAQAYSPADLEHGPVAALGLDVPVIVVATEGPMAGPSRELVEVARQRGSQVIVVSDVPDLLEQADVPIALPGGVPEWLSPLVAIVPLQWLAIATAVALGVDIDKPHGLAKVTKTR